MTCWSFWSTWMATRCGFVVSAATPVEVKAIASRMIVAKRRSITNHQQYDPSLRAERSNPLLLCCSMDCFAPLAMTAQFSWPNQCIAVFGQRQNLPDADLNRNCGGNDARPFAGFAFDGIDRIQADIETHSLPDQTLDPLAVGVLRPQQIDPRTECHHLDRDLVGIVGFEQVVGDADHEALFLGIIVRELQHDAVLGERLVRP